MSSAHTNDEWVSSSSQVAVTGGKYAAVLHTSRGKTGSSLVSNDQSKGAGLIWHDKSNSLISKALIE